MRIVVVTNLCPPDYDGGFELSAFRIAKALRERGNEVELVTSEYRSSYQGPREDPPWVHRIFRLAETRDGWSTAASFLDGKGEQEFSLRSPRKLVQEVPVRVRNILSIGETMRLAPGNEVAMERWLQGRTVDVGYLFGLHRIGTSVTRPLTKRGVPLVYHHGDEWLATYLRPGRLKTLALSALHPVTYRRERDVDLEHVVLVSEFLRGRFLERGFSPEKTGVIYRGVEFPLQTDVDRPRAEPPSFLAASRLEFYKGIHIVLRAAGVLHREASARPWRVWIAGGGDPEAVQTFKRMAEEEGLGERVEFLGKLSRTETLVRMRDAVAFISPSIFGEPLGNTNLEALASGTPLIGSITGAMQEIVDDGVSGLLYEKGDAEALAARMRQILDDPARARELALAGLRRVEERFTMEAVLDETERLFQKVVAER